MALKHKYETRLCGNTLKVLLGLHVPQRLINGDLLKYEVLDNQWSQLKKIICIRTDFCKRSDTVNKNQPQKWRNSMDQLQEILALDWYYYGLFKCYHCQNSLWFCMLTFFVFLRVSFLFWWEVTEHNTWFTLIFFLII